MLESFHKLITVFCETENSNKLMQSIYNLLLHLMIVIPIIINAQA